MLEFRVGLSPYISPIVLDTIAQNSRAGGMIDLCCVWVPVASHFLCGCGRSVEN